MTSTKKNEVTPLQEENDELKFYPRKYCNPFTFRFFIVSVLLLLIGAVVFAIVWLSLPNDVFHGAVASSDMYATRVGMDVLKRGGNAVDAFFAMQAMLTFTEPSSSGIGGGLFLMYYNAQENKFYALDGREEAPADSLEGVLSSDRYGGANVGVPGTVAAMKRAHDKWGTLDISSLFQPTIELARTGIPVDYSTYDAIVRNNNTLFRYNSTRQLFFKQNGQPLQLGDIFKNEDLAATFEHLSQGLDDFYTGQLAQEIVNAVHNDPYVPGNLTLEDLEMYRAIFREPVTFNYKGYEMKGMNMPSSGSVTIALALNILENFNFTQDGYGSLLHLQRILDALSLAFADRNAYLADADWEDIPIEGLIDKDYAKERSKLMNLTRAIVNAPFGYPSGAPPADLTPSKEGNHTTSYSIIDKFGNYLVCTSTIQDEWGSRYVVPGRGFILNNELTDFADSGINRIIGGRKLRKTALAPDNTTLGGKRPRSSMSPTIVLKDGKPVAGLGSPNGQLIIGAVYQVLIDILDFKMSPQDAVLAPRAFAANNNMWLLENGLFNTNVTVEIPQLGIIPRNVSSIGVVAVVMQMPDDSYMAVSDPRRENGLAIFE